MTWDEGRGHALSKGTWTGGSSLPSKAYHLACRFVAHTLLEDRANGPNLNALSSCQPHCSSDRIAQHQFGNRHLVGQLIVGQFAIPDCFLHQQTHVLAREVRG